MGGIAAIGEAHRVQGLGLAGVLVLPAEDPDEVRLRWSGLPGDVALVILTPRADEALADRAIDPLTVVMPR
jgi:vacuolar-type H+-ATPase subunit F/Vma7